MQRWRITFCLENPTIIGGGFSYDEPQVKRNSHWNEGTRLSKTLTKLLTSSIVCFKFPASYTICNDGTPNIPNFQSFSGFFLYCTTCKFMGNKNFEVGHLHSSQNLPYFRSRLARFGSHATFILVTVHRSKKVWIDEEGILINLTCTALSLYLQKKL